MEFKKLIVKNLSNWTWCESRKYY